MTVPTEEQLLEEVRAAFEMNPGPDDALTTKELAEALDVSPETMRQQVPGLIETGKFQAVTVRRLNCWGKPYRADALRLL